MTCLDVPTTIRMIASTSRRVIDAADELSRLDAVAGDGDHGVNMAAAFASAQATLAQTEPASVGEVFLLVGGAFTESGSGSAGVLFGAFFESMGGRLQVTREPGAGDLVEALEIGTRAVAGVGRVAPGDKTMLDALQPAADAAQSMLQAGGDLAAIISAAATGAAQGAGSTAAMRARAGRARYAETGAVGTRDPGAVTTAVMFAAWQEALSPEVGS